MRIGYNKTIELSEEARDALQSFKNPSAFQIALGVAAFAGGFEIASANKDLAWLGVIVGAFGAVFAVFLLFNYIGNAMIVAEWHRAHLDAFNAKVQAEYKPSQPAPAPRVPFPPVRFVEFLHKWFGENGKLPTVEECNENGHSIALAQTWYEQLVNAGAVVGRVHRQHAGNFAPGWTRERMIQAAIDDNKVLK